MDSPFSSFELFLPPAAALQTIALLSLLGLWTLDFGLGRASGCSSSQPTVAQPADGRLKWKFVRWWILEKRPAELQFANDKAPEPLAPNSNARTIDLGARCHASLERPPANEVRRRRRQHLRQHPAATATAAAAAGRQLIKSRQSSIRPFVQSTDKPAIQTSAAAAAAR